MEKIGDSDITVTRHAVDGFTLSYLTDECDYYHRRYLDYSIRDAKVRFKEYVYKEDNKIFRCVIPDDVLLIHER